MGRRSEEMCNKSDDFACIRQLATEFRRAIEKCPRSLLPTTFEQFPLGSCGDATLLVGKHLNVHGYGGFFYVVGFREGQSHAWLQRQSLVVDITADQFEDQPGSVIVSSDSAWHRTFRKDHEHPSDLDSYDPETKRTLTAAYLHIVSMMTAT